MSGNEHASRSRAGRKPHLDVGVLLDVFAFDTKGAAFRVKVHREHLDAQHHPHALATDAAGARLLLHFSVAGGVQGGGKVRAAACGSVDCAGCARQGPAVPEEGGCSRSYVTRLSDVTCVPSARFVLF